MSIISSSVANAIASANTSKPSMNYFNVEAGVVSVLPETVTAHFIDGSETQYYVYQMPEDGECGYHSLGIPRQVVAEQLLKHAHDENIRLLVMPEIMAAVFNNGLANESKKEEESEEESEEEDASDLPESFKTDPNTLILYHAYEKYLKIEVALSAWIHSTKSQLSIDNQKSLNGLTPKELLESPIFPEAARRPLKIKLAALDFYNNAIQTQCASRLVFEAYVRHYIQQPGKWLTLFSEKNGNHDVHKSLTTSTLDAIAKINHLEVIVWIKEDQSGLYCLRHCKGEQDLRVVNMYFAGNHFNQLHKAPNLQIYPVKTGGTALAGVQNIPGLFAQNPITNVPARVPLKVRVKAFRDSHPTVSANQMLREIAKMYADDAVLLGVDWIQAFYQYYHYDAVYPSRTPSRMMIQRPPKKDELIVALDNVFQTTFPVNLPLSERLNKLRAKLGIQTLTQLRMMGRAHLIKRHQDKMTVACAYADEAAIFLGKKWEATAYEYNAVYTPLTMAQCSQMEVLVSLTKETLLARGECFSFAKQIPTFSFQPTLKIAIKKRGTEVVLIAKKGEEIVCEQTFNHNLNLPISKEGFSFGFYQGRFQFAPHDIGSLEIESDIPLDFHGTSNMQGMKVTAPEVSLNGLIHAEAFICKAAICKNRGNLRSQNLLVEGRQFTHDSGSIIVGGEGIVFKVEELTLNAPISTSGSLWTGPLSKFDYAENAIKVESRCSLNLAKGVILTKNLDIKGQLDINVAFGEVALENRAHLKASRMNINTPLTGNTSPFKNSGTLESSNGDIFISSAGVLQGPLGRLLGNQEIYLLQSKPSTLQGSIVSPNLKLKALNPNSEFRISHSCIQVPNRIVIDSAGGVAPPIQQFGRFTLLELRNPPSLPNLSGDIPGSISIYMDNVKQERMLPITILNNTHIHGDLFISAPHLTYALGGATQKVQWKVDGEVTINSTGFIFRNGMLAAKDDITFNNNHTIFEGKEHEQSALLSGGLITINSSRDIRIFYGMIYGEEGVQLKAPGIIRDKASQVSSPNPIQINAGKTIDTDLTQQRLDTEHRDQELLRQHLIRKEKRRIKRVQRKVVIKAVAGLALGAGSVAFFGPLLFVESAAGMTGAVSAAGKGMLFAAVNGVVTGQKAKDIIKNVGISAVTGGLGHLAEGLQFIRALPTETAREFCRGAIQGAAGSALRGDNVMVGLAVGGLSGAVIQRAGLTSNKTAPVGMRQAMNEAGISVARGTVAAGIATLASPQGANAKQFVANVALSAASSGIESLAKTAGTTLGNNVVARAEERAAAKAAQNATQPKPSRYSAGDGSARAPKASGDNPQGNNQSSKPAESSQPGNKTPIVTASAKPGSKPGAKQAINRETPKAPQSNKGNKEVNLTNKNGGATVAVPAATTTQGSSNKKKEDGFSLMDLLIRPAHADTLEDWTADANSNRNSQDPTQGIQSDQARQAANRKQMPFLAALHDANWEINSPRSHPNVAIRSVIKAGQGIRTIFEGTAEAMTHPVKTVKDTAVLVWDVAGAVTDFTHGQCTEASRTRNQERLQGLKQAWNKYNNGDIADKLGMATPIAFSLLGGSVLGSSSFNNPVITVPQRVITHTSKPSAVASVEISCNNVAKTALKGTGYLNTKDRIQHEALKTQYRQKMDLKNPLEIRDLKLRKVIADLYKDKAQVGSGSTADAIRREIATGEPTQRLFHSKKGEYSRTFLKKWLENNPIANIGDRAIAENALLDLNDALGERMWYSKTIVPN